MRAAIFQLSAASRRDLPIRVAARPGHAKKALVYAIFFSERAAVCVVFYGDDKP